MKLKTSIALASLLLISAPTLSADPLSFTNPFSTSSGTPGSYNPVYFGGSLGYISDDNFCSGQSNCDDSDMGWKLFAGYDYSERVAFEVGYNSLGSFASSTSKSEVSGFEFAALGKMPLNDQISLFGKAGLFKWTADNTTGKRSAADFMFGAGVDYKMNDNMSLRGEWERFNDIETKATDTSDIDMISAGFTYRTL